MLWATWPACTELETVMLDWLAELLDLPAAVPRPGRRRHPGHRVLRHAGARCSPRCTGTPAAAVRRDGVRDRYAVYTSPEAHSSIEKAARIAGLGDDRAAGGRGRPGRAGGHRRLAARGAVEADRAAGVRPLLVVATVGTTSTTAVDPVPAIGALCREYGVWLHVDAAYAGVARSAPSCAGSTTGWSSPTRTASNPHKWLLTGFDCDAFWVADRAALVGALTVLPEYLRNAATESGAVIDYRDWQVPLGRRFRALKLWFVLRWYGAEGLRAHVRSRVGLAGRLRRLGARRPALRGRRAAPVVAGLLPAARPSDEANEELLAAVNDSGEAYLSHTRVRGRLRAAAGRRRHHHRSPARRRRCGRCSVGWSGPTALPCPRTMPGTAPWIAPAGGLTHRGRVLARRTGVTRTRRRPPHARSAAGGDGAGR